LEAQDLEVREICTWLQAYKGYVSTLCGYNVELSMNAAGEISFEKVSSKSAFDNTLVDMTFKKPDLFDQFNAGLSLRVVDDWLEVLEPLERQIIFFAYMLHNYEKHRGWFEEMREGENGKKKYKTLSYKKIADMFGSSEGTIRNIRDKAFGKIIQKIKNDNNS
jgi:hypothetical protein